MKVSIIIPVYNAEKYLDKCITSALHQTYENIEIIAVNDGSTDNSLQILKKYSNKIKIIDKINGGTATALNAGIKAMTGEWFKWLSADDILLENSIESFIQETKKIDSESHMTIFYSNYYLIDESSTIIGQFVEPNYSNLSNFEKNITSGGKGGIHHGTCVS